MTGKSGRSARTRRRSSKPSMSGTNAPLLALGQALLMINTLVDEPGVSPGSVGLDTEEGWNRWAYFQYFVGASTTNDDPLRLSNTNKRPNRIQGLKKMDK